MSNLPVTGVIQYVDVAIDLQFWGGRDVQVRDSFGILWSIGSTPK